MFLHVLDEAEQRLFAQVALRIVHADNNLDPREVALLEALQLEMGLEEMPTAAAHGEDELSDLEEIESRTVARVFAFELAGVVIADGNVHEEQRAILIEVTGRLGINAEETERFLDFALRAHSYWEEARELVSETSD